MAGRIFSRLMELKALAPGEDCAASLMSERGPEGCNLNAFLYPNAHLPQRLKVFGKLSAILSTEDPSGQSS